MRKYPNAKTMKNPETTILPLSILTLTSIVACIGYVNIESAHVVENVVNDVHNGINLTSIQRLQQMDLRHPKCRAHSRRPIARVITFFGYYKVLRVLKFTSKINI